MARSEKRTIDFKVKKALKTLQRDFFVVGKERVENKTAWLVIAFAAGIALAFLYIANRDLEFEKGDAATFTYQASVQFSGVQGQNRWWYIEWPSSVPMTYKVQNPNAGNLPAWQGSEQYSLIGSYWMTPGTNSKVARRWIANQSGAARITSQGLPNVRMLGTSCGAGADGVIVSITHYRPSTSIYTVLWTKSIAWNNTTGYSFDLSGIQINSGDIVDFLIDRGPSNNYCDSTYFDAVIIFDEASLPATGKLLIKRVDQNFAILSGTLANVDRRLTDPCAEGTICANNPSDFSGVTLGGHGAHATDLTGYTEQVGMCTYLIGASECADNTITYRAPDDCVTTLGDCNTLATVSAGQITKVVYRYTKTGGGGGLGVVGGLRINQFEQVSGTPSDTLTLNTTPPVTATYGSNNAYGFSVPSGTYTLTSGGPQSYDVYYAVSPEIYGVNWQKGLVAPANVVAGQALNIWWKYVPLISQPKETIRGYIINAPSGALFDPPAYPATTISVAGADTCNCNTAQNGNPYFATVNQGGTYTVTASAVPGYTISYAIYSNGKWAADVPSNTVTVTVPAGGIDVWWKYTAVANPTGKLLIKRVDQNFAILSGTLANVDRRLTDPCAEGTICANNPSDFSGVTLGGHGAHATDLTGYTEQVGMCTYLIGASECADNTITYRAPDDCVTTLGDCNTLATVSAGQVTKVVYRYTSTGTSPPSGTTDEIRLDFRYIRDYFQPQVTGLGFHREIKCKHFKLKDCAKEELLIVGNLFTPTKRFPAASFAPSPYTAADSAGDRNGIITWRVPRNSSATTQYYLAFSGSMSGENVYTFFHVCPTDKTQECGMPLMAGGKWNGINITHKNGVNETIQMFAVDDSIVSSGGGFLTGKHSVNFDIGCSDLTNGGAIKCVFLALECAAGDAVSCGYLAFNLLVDFLKKVVEKLFVMAAEEIFGLNDKHPANKPFNGIPVHIPVNLQCLRDNKITYFANSSPGTIGAEVLNLAAQKFNQANGGLCEISVIHMGNSANKFKIPIAEADGGVVNKNNRNGWADGNNVIQYLDLVYPSGYPFGIKLFYDLLPEIDEVKTWASAAGVPASSVGLFGFFSQDGWGAGGQGYDGANGITRVYSNSRIGIDLRSIGFNPNSNETFDLYNNKHVIALAVAADEMSHNMFSKQAVAFAYWDVLGNYIYPYDRLRDLWNAYTHRATELIKKPDLVITEFRMSPAFPVEGDAVQLFAKIKNHGLATASGPFRATAIITTQPVFTTLESGFLSGLTEGLEKEVLIGTWAAKAGVYTAFLLADSQDTVSEMNELNNRGTGDMKVGLPLPTARLSEQVGRTLLEGMGFSIKPPCVGIAFDNCVRVDGVRQATIDAVQHLDTQCNLSGEIITGLTEGDPTKGNPHSVKLGDPYNHYSGWKIDIRATHAVDACVKKIASNGPYRRGDGAVCYDDFSAQYCKEMPPTGYPHWDVEAWEVTTTK